MKYKNIIFLVFKTFQYFQKRRKFQLIFNLILLIINAILELITISMTLSLFSVMTRPDNLIRNNFLEFLFGSTYNQDINSQIYYVTFTFISIVLISTSLRLFNLRYSTYLAQNIGTDFCTFAFKSFLNQDYNYHLRKNSSDIISTININIDGSITAIDSFFSINFLLANFFVHFIWIILYRWKNYYNFSLHYIFYLFLNKYI